jgi:hypothetical protein
MRKIRILLLIIPIGIFLSCNSHSNTILEIGNGNDVIVSFEILDNNGIDKVVFRANGKSEVVSSENLSNYSVVKFGFDGKGEGTFNICVYNKTDTICSEHYVEGGYRPKLKYIDNRIDVDDHTGIGY